MKKKRVKSQNLITSLTVISKQQETPAKGEQEWLDRQRFDPHDQHKEEVTDIPVHITCWNYYPTPGSLAVNIDLEAQEEYCASTVINEDTSKTGRIHLVLLAEI